VERPPHLAFAVAVAPAVAVALAVVFAFEIERGFSPASKPSREAALPLCRRQERSPKGEATRLLPLLLPVLARQTQHRDKQPPTQQSLTTFFSKNSPKTACQVPKPLIHNKTKEITSGILVTLKPL
jgi:hypothetical protein